MRSFAKRVSSLLLCLPWLLIGCGGGGDGGEANSDAFAVACSGTHCGAVTNTSYSGSGVGVWKYENTSSTGRWIDIRIDGLSTGKKVTLVFTNPQETPAASVPAVGSAVSANSGLTSSGAAVADAPPGSDRMRGLDDAHQHVLQLNQASKRQLQSTRSLSAPRASVLASAVAAAPASTPALGSLRDWRELAFSGTTYASTNKHVCALANGRNVVFWQANNDTLLSTSLLSRFTTAICTGGGGFDKLVGLIGDFWGPHTQAGSLISDAAGKQDVNVVFVNAGTASSWAGYFWGQNNHISSTETPSNQALVFFLNTSNTTDDITFGVSSLIHEAKHMISYYQETVLRSKNVDTWYEESSAMMAEDIIVPSIVSNTSPLAQYRLPVYMASGGGVSLNNWPSLDSAYQHYAMGAALAAFLNRRYGTDLFKNSIQACDSGPEQSSSYTCLNQWIQKAGGAGLGDELARMGASVFARSRGSNLPTGYGFPAVSSNGFVLPAIDLSGTPLGRAPMLLTYPSMSQTYATWTAGLGVSSYRREGIYVPGNTGFYLVVQ